MRVTDSMMFAQLQAGLADRRDQLAKAQSTVASGQRVAKPSDDPTAAAQARVHSAAAAKADSHERTVNVALTALQIADSALDQVGETLTRAHELALQASNGTLNDSDMQNIGNEVDALRTQTISLANTQAAGRYVFAGMKDSSSPYAADGSYVGDSQAQQVEVGKGLNIESGVPGDRVFGAAGGGQDAFAVLQDLHDALTNHDADGIRASLDRITQVQSQVAASRSELGGNLDTAQVALSVAQRVHDQSVTARSKLIDADPFTSYSDVQRAQGALEAAVSVASQLPPPGLASRARI